MANKSPYTDAKKKLLDEYREMLKLKYQTKECTQRKTALRTAHAAILEAREICNDTTLTNAHNIVDVALGKEIARWNTVGEKMKKLEDILNEFGF